MRVIDERVSSTYLCDQVRHEGVIGELGLCSGDYIRKLLCLCLKVKQTASILFFLIQKSITSIEGLCCDQCLSLQQQLKKK